MSKLISHIKAHQTNRRFPVPNGPLRYSDMTSIETRAEELHGGYLIEYRIDVRLGAAFRAEPGSDLSSQLRHTARMLEHEVFGEFRDDIDKMYRALWERDCEKAMELLEAMRQRMFSA